MSSRPELTSLPSATAVPKRRTRLLNSTSPASARRASVSGGVGQKALRTSKTSQKLVVLPSAPQTKPLPEDEDPAFGYETDAGVREYKSSAERMTKEQRKRAGHKRITVYCICESFKTKLLSSFLKREHNVAPRVFDEALYVMYHLPLLPGYGPNVSLRSSLVHKSRMARSILTRLSEAEEDGYQGTYFPPQHSPEAHPDGYISSSSPVFSRPHYSASHEVHASDADTEVEPIHAPSISVGEMSAGESLPTPYSDEIPRSEQLPSSSFQDEEVAEAVFFAYGVVVFFGFEEAQERSILEDLDVAGIMKKKIPEDDWEIEECHFAHDRHIAYPRIYNDFFTLKSRSHLLKLSIAHALAQSTLLAHYETTAQRVLSSPQTLSIPQQLATSGALQLKRREALKLTGSLFKLRQDINLVSNVLDVPELFWSEASLKELYDAVREYMEIKGRVQGLNEKLGVASSFLDAIHDHLNNFAMERITWIIIWLIVAAILVEMGEVLARLIVHATTRQSVAVPASLTREEVLLTLERMMNAGSSK
ncbi:unnamed protein product [Mycena citricolor]|uniref:DUF155 domain-containing protein n=1 Tax=Mycena citricolor TaxID=2018698 RepID=A0AAD2HCU4_9AGAR|nr:unnamed protein product [Mycena citricolor]CAK5273853.1 unnamed protein product [Mycena citricolor]